MLSTVLIAWESNSVVRFSSSRSENPSNGTNSLTVSNSVLSWAACTADTREDRGVSSSESEDSDEEMTSAFFEGDDASKI